jgi:very-short-patch-repair endonuclease
MPPTNPRGTRLPLDLAIAALADQHDGLVPVAALRSANYSADAIADRVARQLLASPRRGIRIRSGVQLDVARQALAAALTLQDSWISHTTALTIHGLDLSTYGVHLSAPTQHRLVDVQMHRHQMPLKTDLGWYEGVRISTATRAVLESAAILDLRSLEVAMDWALHNRRTSIDRLASTAEHVGWFRGRTDYLKLIDDRRNGRGQVRSFLEVDIDRVLRKAGIPLPTRNFSVTLPTGRRIIDAAWPVHRLGLEANSWEHHSRPSDWANTQTRQRELTAAGWTILPVVSSDVRRPAALLNQIRVLLG